MTYNPEKLTLIQFKIKSDNDLKLKGEDKI